MKLTAYDKPIRLPRTEARADPGSLTQQARAAGIDPSTVRARMKRGMTLEQALSTPPMSASERARRAGKARAAQRGGRGTA